MLLGCSEVCEGCLWSALHFLQTVWALVKPQIIKVKHLPALAPPHASYLLLFIGVAPWHCSDCYTRLEDWMRRGCWGQDRGESGTSWLVLCAEAACAQKLSLCLFICGLAALQCELYCHNGREGEDTTRNRPQRTVECSIGEANRRNKSGWKKMQGPNLHVRHHWFMFLFADRSLFWWICGVTLDCPSPIHPYNLNLSFNCFFLRLSSAKLQLKTFLLFSRDSYLFLLLLPPTPLLFFLFWLLCPLRPLDHWSQKVNKWKTNQMVAWCDLDWD